MKQKIVIQMATLLMAIVLGAASASAQSITLGARAPRLGSSEWLTDRPNLKGKALLVEFFHSTNPKCQERIEELNQLAANYKESLNVVVVAREPREQIAEMMLHDYQHFYVAIDEAGTIFKSFEVRYVPSSVLTNHRGVILWTGNSALLDQAIIDKFIPTK